MVKQLKEIWGHRTGEDRPAVGCELQDHGGKIESGWTASPQHLLSGASQLSDGTVQKDQRGRFQLGVSCCCSARGKKVELMIGVNHRGGRARPPFWGMGIGWYYAMS